MKYLTFIIVFALIFSLIPQQSLAALSFSDSVSDIRPSNASNHLIKWTVADAGGIAEGEGFDLIFDSGFDTASIASSDIDLMDNGIDLSISGNCNGVNELSFVNNGNDSFSFTICPGDGGAILSGHTVEVEIGTIASGGTNRIINPPSTGSYSIIVSGNSGYADYEKTQVALIGGTAVTAQVGPQAGNLRIIGYANPQALVYFLEGGSTIGTQSANSSSYFDKTLIGLEEGIHIISIYATDQGARSTLTISFGVNVVANTTTIVSGILLPPTLALSGSSVKRPAELTASGMAKNNSTVQIFTTGSGDNKTESKAVNGQGNWSININPKLHLGYKTTYGITLDGMGGISEISQTRIFEVLLSADLNVDNMVNLTDFSILMFNYGTSNPPNVIADINDNGPVDLVDFSVMMYYWTGG